MKKILYFIVVFGIVGFGLFMASSFQKQKYLNICQNESSTFVKCALFIIPIKGITKTNPKTYLKNAACAAGSSEPRCFTIPVTPTKSRPVMNIQNIATKDLFFFSSNL